MPRENDLDSGHSPWDIEEITRYIVAVPFQKTQNGRINILQPTIIIELPRQRARDFRGSGLHSRKNTAPRRTMSGVAWAIILDPDEVENGVETCRHPRRVINRFVHRLAFSREHVELRYLNKSRKKSVSKSP